MPVKMSSTMCLCYVDFQSKYWMLQSTLFYQEVSVLTYTFGPSIGVV